MQLLPQLLRPIPLPTLLLTTQTINLLYDRHSTKHPVAQQPMRAFRTTCYYLQLVTWIKIGTYW
ncbi:hypothetical protein ZHAS_00004016 [Anopheles sinensis]|uniref:Uncharacterized protein n=1 Tax=Anopheles sinensis TaxID=74873 RepID=A0A084VFV4_ANOSI|nr:hypothetical protein ZHAS_00004016 [Anopheles sinensis]